MALTKAEKWLRALDIIDEMAGDLADIRHQHELQMLACTFMECAHKLRYWQNQLPGEKDLNDIERQMNAAAVMFANACEHLVHAEEKMNDVVEARYG